MSLAESGDSTAAVSLTELFDGKLGRHSGKTSLDTIIWLAVRGGWPGSLGLDEASALEIPRHYIEQTARIDMSRVDGKKRVPQKVERLLRSLARNNMMMVANSTLLKDTQESSGSPAFSEPTLISYLGALRKLFVIEELPAWSPKLRSTARARTTPKKHFVDPSLAIAALGADRQQLKADLNTFGFIFENLVIRDLKVYAEALGAKLFHYHDKQGLEVDAIVETPEGRWAGIEVKLGAGEADAAAKSLLALEQRVVAAGGASPTFLAALCGVCDYSYTREDGVHVIPITALGI